ncbi:MAG: diiron oxygenase [Aquabacterium sp.]
MTSATSNMAAIEQDNVSRWYANATVRHSDRILVPDNSKGEFIFPRSRQLLSEHPAVVAKGHDAVAYVLAQSAYKYMYEIGLLETRFVIDCSLNIINNKIKGFNDDEKREALTIVIDEGYHAYVALDFIIQMKALTGVQPIEVPEANGNLRAVQRAMDALPTSMHDDFQLISVCLAEHTLTKDLVSIGREKDATASFTQVMTDHVSDEGRHANYFARLMKQHWVTLSEATKTTIGFMLPNYLDDYLAGDDERSFDKKILLALGMSEAEALRVIDDTHPAFMDNLHTYVSVTKANLVKLLARCGIMDHEATKASFIAHGVSV